MQRTWVAAPRLLRCGFFRTNTFSNAFVCNQVYYSTKPTNSKHADKIRQVKAKPMKKKPSKPSKPKLRPKKKSNPLDLTFKPPGDRPGEAQDPDSDVDLNNPIIKDQVDQLEKQYIEIQTEASKPIVDYDIERIGEGEVTEDEEEQELLEQISTDEPAFSVREYASQLSQAKTMHEFLQINFAFKSEDYARMLESQYAENINVIDVRQKSQIYDYMIIATMSSGRQRKAAANYIYLQGKKRYQLACEYGSPFVKECLSKNKVGEVPSISKDAHEWVVLDCGNVSINLFDHETRKYYDLDNLWENEILARNSDEMLDWNIKMNAEYERKGKRQNELDYYYSDDEPLR